MGNKIQTKILQLLLENMDEGVHVLDEHGYTLVYNRAMERIEGLLPEEVVGKHFSETFPQLQTTSTLLQAIEHNQVIENYRQDYRNFRGERISSINYTYPINVEGQVRGAMEISTNVTLVEELSSKIEKLLPTPELPIKPNYFTFDSIIGSSLLMKEAIRVAKRCAATDATVLIVGQTGTGKEMFAQSIHNQSQRSKHPFIAINCAALAESLLESLLFGTVKGAFTDSVDRKGLFEQANHGTLFLDEINSMSLNLQAKLLRVIQESFVRKVGGSTDIPIDVRIIAATNQSPQRQVEEGSLRRDLYYRLNVMRLDLPSLAQRPEDIEELAEYFLDKFRHKTDQTISGITPDFLEALKRHDFKGNVRELEHLLEAAVTLKESSGVLEVNDLPKHFFLEVDDQMISFYREDQPLSEYLADIERNLIRSAFYREKGSVSSAAKRLGMPRQNLQYKLKKYGII